MTATPLDSLDAVRGHITAHSRTLDPTSRYIAELLAIAGASADVADFEARLARGCRGSRHAGADVFARMSLADKIRTNLVTAETALFRFAERELEAARAVMAARAAPIRARHSRHRG